MFCNLVDVSDELCCRFAMQTLTHLQPTRSVSSSTGKSTVDQSPSIQYESNDDHSLMFALVQIDDRNEVTASADTAISVGIIFSN